MVLVWTDSEDCFWGSCKFRDWVSYIINKGDSYFGFLVVIFEKGYGT